MILDKIIAAKSQRLAKQKERVPLDCLMPQIENFEQKDVSFKQALINKNELSIIAEVKKASPSKGILQENFNPVVIAKEYVRNNVAAISVLTEEDYFLGSDRYLQEIRQKVNAPILRKDFIIDEYQIYQAKVIGANAILLIAAVLNTKQLQSFIDISNRLNLDCLVEVHNKEELLSVLDTGAEIIGINNRNLHTFHTDITTTEKLIEYIPDGRVLVSESGIYSRQDMRYLANLKVDAVLIGESLMCAPSIEEKLQEIGGVYYR